MAEQFDVIVIGGGPGGYVAAIRAAQLGFKVACVDKRASLGGTCLNVGCIPSKALLQSSHKYDEAVHHMSGHGVMVEGLSLDLEKMMARKDKIVSDLTKGVLFLLKKNKVTFIHGEASFESAQSIQVTDQGGRKTLYQAKNFIIATGSEPTALPNINIDENEIVTSTGALSLSKVPEHLVVIGGGYIGLEMGSVWKRLGSKVTVVEYFNSIVPQMDKEVGQAFMKALKAQGIDFHLQTKVIGYEKNGERYTIHLESADGQTKDTVECDVLLSCAGRRPYTGGLNLDKAGLQVSDRGQIEVNEHLATSVPHIYAIGDVIRGPMLAHKAEEEGVAVAEYIAGQKPHVNYNVIPAVVYTHPEVATVGKTQEELQAQNIPFKVGKFPFSANSRARANGDTEGFVKILSHKETDEVLGVHILHSQAGTLIAEAAMAMEYRASSEDIARTCHAHPTESEAIKEAALSVAGRAIHM